MERFAVHLTPRDAHENRLCSGLLSAWLLQTMLLAVRRYDADWIRPSLTNKVREQNIPSSGSGGVFLSVDPLGGSSWFWFGGAPVCAE
jgi:hypothetical protein